MHTKNLALSLGRAAAGMAGSALLLLVGCGDNTFKTSVSHIDPESIPPDHACFDGSTIELTRHSSECAKSSLPLVAQVRHGVVFPANLVGTLGSPCSSGPTPEIEVIFDMEAHSIIFDFSNVAHGDRFPGGDFEGYIFDVALETSNGLLIGVAIDDDASTLMLDADDLEWDEAHIEVNFAGVAYDDRDSLKIDLTFARLSPVDS